MKPGRPERGSDRADDWRRSDWRLARISEPVEKSDLSPRQAFPGSDQAYCGAGARESRRERRSGSACRPFGDRAVGFAAASPFLVDCPRKSSGLNRQITPSYAINDRATRKISNFSATQVLAQDR